MDSEKRNDKKLELKGKYIETTQGKNFAKRMETLNNETSEIINSEEDIVSLKKEYGRNSVSIEMSDGEAYRFAPNQYTQLFYDKIEMQNKREAKIEKTRIEVLPFQNKIQYFNADTKEFLGQVLIDTSMKYEMHDQVTGEKVEYSKDLNPAILSLLDNDKNTQKAYMQGNDNLEIVYDFTRKSPYKQENKRNGKVAKIMDKFFHSEKKYMEEKGKAEPPVKIGFASLKDKIKAFFNMPVKKVDDKPFDEVNLDELTRMDEEMYINADDEPTEKLHAITEQDVKEAEAKAAEEKRQDEIKEFIEKHSIIVEEKKKEEENEPVEYVDLGECTVEDKEGNIVLDTKEKEDKKRAEEAKEQKEKLKAEIKSNQQAKAKAQDLFEKKYGKKVSGLNHMGYKRNAAAHKASKKKETKDIEDR